MGETRGSSYEKEVKCIPLPLPRNREALEGPSFFNRCSALKCGYDSIVLLRPS